MTEIEYLNNPQTSIRVFNSLSRTMAELFAGEFSVGCESERFLSVFLKIVVYDSDPIWEEPLAVTTRVKYTGPMIWKFKKTDSAAANLNPSHGPEQARSAVESGASIITPSKVENQDIATSRPDGSYVIPRDYRISGTIVTNRHVVVEGELCGQALVAPSVHVGAEGRLKVPTQSAKVTVSGTVESPLSAREIVEVRKGGVIRNDVEAGELSILPGGLVVGARLSIGPLRGQL